MATTKTRKPNPGLKPRASRRAPRTATERAVMEALAGNIQPLHELLRREDSTLGRAYAAVAQIYDRFALSGGDGGYVTQRCATALTELRQIVIESERTD